MNESDRLDDLLARWEEAREAGQPLTPKDLCPDWPEGQEELRRRARLLLAVDAALNLTTDPAAPPAGKPEVPGYEVLEELGRGGMGVVYRGRHRQLGWEVAIKVLRPGREAWPGLVQWFIREAQALTRLRHLHIVPIHAADLHRGEPYIVMDLMPGGSLARRLSRNPLDPGAATVLVQKVARAVHHAHDKGILHRDLKPHNILLDEGGEPRVSDFGLAKLFNPPAGPDGLPAGGLEVDGEKVPPSLGDGLGTPPYMAPEQYRPGLGPVSPATDVWALGVILYELLTGVRPFDGPRREDIERAVCEARLVRPSAVQPGVPLWLDAVCLRCLEKDPRRRYHSAAVLAEHLGKRRGKWRHAAAAAVLAVSGGMGVVVVGAPFSSAPKPEAPREELYRRATAEVLRNLRRGREVTLVSPGQPPPVFRWRSGDGKVQWQGRGAEDGGIAVETDGLGLVELLPEVPCEAFRITAELRHVWNYFPLGDIGVYFAHHVQALPAGPRHWFGLARFADLGLLAQGFVGEDGKRCSRFVLKARFVGAPALPYPENFGYGEGGIDFMSLHPKQGPGDWRTVAVEVRRDELRAVWAGKAIALDLARASEQLGTLVGRWHPDVLRDRPRLRPRGGVGMYLVGSGMAVRQFKVEPLTAP